MKCLLALLFVCSLTLVICVGQSLAMQRPGNFTVLGPGGGGAMFNPTVSPHDPNTVLVSCDMTGSYITHDGGQTWRMFNLGDVVHFFVFDPVDPNTIYAGTEALWRSSDGGDTWRLIYPQPADIRSINMNSDHADETIVAEPDHLGRILALAVDPRDSKLLYTASTKANDFNIFISRDAGNSWDRFGTLQEKPLGMWVQPHSAGKPARLIVVTKNSVSTLGTTGSQTIRVPSQLGTAAVGFQPNEEVVIYGVSDTEVLVSRNGGVNWDKSKLPGSGARLRAVATSLHHPSVAYLSYSALNAPSGRSAGARSSTWMGVAKTSDVGGSWNLVWKEGNEGAANVHDAWITARFGPEWPENPLMIGVDDNNPDLVYTTDLGRTMRSTDGGATWAAVYSHRTAGHAWRSTGLDVTTNYGVHFDPFDVKRRFITYTDIGLFRSEDAGQSWQSSTNGVPKDWVNTTYWLVFDPHVRGRMWSVNSGTHDLPRPKMWRHNSVLGFKGGVCRSDDGGRTWVRSNRGMDETAPTHILLDPKSPAHARVLYVAAFGRGVYKSTDGGRTWKLKNKGISQAQPLAWRLTLDSGGALYLVVARRSEDGSIDNPGDGALYRSTDGAESWQPIALPLGVNGPNGLAIDTKDSKRLYLAAWARATGTHGEGGGIFLSEDGGKNWRQVLDKDRHVYDVTTDPNHPDWLFASGFESSALRSVDRGEHWSRIAGFNFKWGHRVIADPEHSDQVYVTTFGGSVWHGSLNGKPAPLDIASPELDPQADIWK